MSMNRAQSHLGLSMFEFQQRCGKYDLCEAALAASR
jgi:hypothetical protein